MGSQAALSEDELVQALRRVSWFRRLPDAQLRTLCGRGRLECCLRYRTIIREGNRGRYFYVLLQGQVHCTSQTKKGLSVRLGPGAAFGEGALVTTVQREASVVAIEPCQLMLLTADDMVGVDVDLSTVRSHVVTLILESIPFFRDMTSLQRDGLSDVMDMAYFPKGSVIFEEGDTGDSFYVLLEGVVQMRKRTSNDAVIALFRPMTERPWFGELAMLGGAKKRTCAACCVEAAKVLIVRQANFAQFLEIAPAFHTMFMSSASGYAALDAMRRKLEGDDDVLKSGVALLRAKVGEFLTGGDEGGGGGFPFGPAPDDADLSDAGEELTERQQRVYPRWKELAQAVLAKVRGDAGDE